MNDIAGNFMTADKTWSFATASSLTQLLQPLRRTVPTSGATGVAAYTLVTGTFTEPVQGSTVSTSTFALKAGTYQYSRNSNTEWWKYSTFDPTSSLAALQRTELLLQEGLAE